MILKCNKIISPATKEDLGNSSPWLTIGNIYPVLALQIISNQGIKALIQTEHYNEPGFFPLVGFGVVSQSYSSTWTIKKTHSGNRVIINILPEAWAYDSFYDDLENEEANAVCLFNEGSRKIYAEYNL